jgi:NADH:ubiquinone oxidoreductase subunit 3 (subunit A)
MSIKLLFITTVIKPHKYVIVLSYILISLILTLILFLAAYFLAPKKSYNEKNSAYECGFEPFGDAKSSFDIQFYTVTMLFIIFDLEIAYLYP